jgi:hypothetical protein
LCKLIVYPTFQNYDHIARGFCGIDYGLQLINIFYNTIYLIKKVFQILLHKYLAPLPIHLPTQTCWKMSM